MLGIPNDVVDATEHLLRLADDWEPRAVDLGRVNGRWFTFAAGFGLDASVVERVDAHPHLKARFGAWYYASAAVGVFLRRYVVNPPRIEIETGGETVRGVSAFFQNGEPYTYFKARPVNLVEGTRLDSGDLAGVMLTRARPYDVPRSPSARSRAPPASPGTAASTRSPGLQEATLRSVDGRPVPLQVDGDHMSDETVAELSVAAGALRVVS